MTVTVSSLPTTTSSIKISSLNFIFFKLLRSLINEMPLEEPPQFGFEIIGNLELESKLISLGERILSLLFK